MVSLSNINKILFLLILLILIGAGTVYGWTTWENDKIKDIAIEHHIKVTTTEPAPETNFIRNLISDIKQAKTAIIGDHTVFEKSAFAKIAASKNQVVASSPNNTSSSGKSGFTFAAIGDSENFSISGYNDELPKVLSEVKEHNPDLVFFTGDILVLDDPNPTISRPKIENVKNLIEKYFSKYYISFGNHDVDCGDACADMWLDVMFKKKNPPAKEPGQAAPDRALYHSLDYENTHLVILSSGYPQEKAIDDSQLQWLEQDLAATTKENKIVFSHVPPVNFFPKSARDCHDMSCNTNQRDKLLAILQKYKVDLVVSGHEHAFDHKIVDGIDYVLCGDSGNSPKYDGVIKGDIYSIFRVLGNKIDLTAIDSKGRLIREINIK